MSNPKITKAQALAALKETRGTIFLAAERLGCSARTIRRMRDKYPAIQEAIQNARGRRVDVSELKLDLAIDNGEPWAIRLVLNTLGSDRGYGKQLELKGKINVDVREVVVTNREEAKAALALVERENISTNGQAG